MPTDVLMPALSPTMEEGKLAKWLINEGDEVAIGDVIAEIETDKATMEVEATEEGKVAKILISAGTAGVKVNTPIAVIAGDDDAIANGEVTRDNQAHKTEQIADNDNGVKNNDMESHVRNHAGNGADPNASPSALNDYNQPSMAASPKPPATEIANDPEISPDTEMVEITVREALRDALAEEMRHDDSVFLMGEEVAEYQGAYKVSQGLLEEFGVRRVIDTPITEHGFAGLGVGAAFSGLRPVVEFMTFNFAMQAMDQIINSAAKTLYMSGGQMLSAITFRGPNGAASRVAAQHSQDYAAWYAHVPGLKVIMPYSASDAKGLLKAAIRDPNPVIFLENEILYGHKFKVPVDNNFFIPIGKAKVAKSGADVTIVSWGIGMRYVNDALVRLSELNIDAEVIDLRTLRPLDETTIIESIKKTGRCVTVEEGWPRCSMSSEIAALVMEKAFDYLDAPVLKVTGKDVPMPYAANLEKLALPSVAEVVEAVRAVCYK